MEKIAWGNRFRNLVQITKDPRALLIGLIAFGVVIYLGILFGDMSVTVGNLGKHYFYIQHSAHILLALFFGLFIAATVYKIRYFRSVNGSTTTVGGAGGIIGVILIGCPACSISIASYLGLGTLLIHLPGFGLELKILGLLVLIRATYTTIDSLYTCNFSNNKKSLP